MKKSILLILMGVFIVTASPLWAQSSSSQLVINPQIGISLSKLSTDPPTIPPSEAKYRLGYQFGGYLRLGGNVYVQPGVFWHRMGVKLQTVSAIENQHDFENDISTIQVPVLLGVNLINADKLVLRANGGGYAAFVTSVHDNPLYTKDDLKKTVFGARVGVGVDFFNLTGDVGYDFGLTKFFDDRVGSEAKLRGWFMSVGVKLM